MNKELIVYMGIDFGDVDRTAYGLYDPETGKFQEIDKEEYENLIRVYDPTIPYVDKFQR